MHIPIMHIHGKETMGRGVLMKRLGMLVVLLLLSAAWTACSGGNDEGGFAADQSVTVKVMYYDELQFFRDYGELILSRYPNIDIEVVSTGDLYPMEPDPDFNYDEALLKLIEQQNPDVLMLGESQYRTYYDEGRLLDLEPLIERDQYDIDTVAPGIIELLRDLAGGSIHGFSPTFYSEALYYNIDLFDAHGIPHPTDQMTWEDVIMLAKRFPTGGAGDDRIYGYSIGRNNQVSDFLQRIATTEGLIFVDPLQKQVTIQGNDWVRIFEMVADLYRAEAVAPAEPLDLTGMMIHFEDYLLGEPFTAGKAAMIVDGPYLLNNLNEVSKHLPDHAFNYGVVTAPVDPKNPDRGGRMSVYNIFAIHASSAEVNAAWEIVKFINSEDMARIKSKATYDLLARTTYPERFGTNIEAFYKLNPQSIQTLQAGFEDLPGHFLGTFNGMIQTELEAILAGDKTVEEAIETLQTEGQKTLMAEDAAFPDPFNTVEHFETEPIVEMEITDPADLPQEQEEQED